MIVEVKTDFSSIDCHIFLREKLLSIALPKKRQERQSTAS
jgi:hypothetical protein